MLSLFDENHKYTDHGKYLDLAADAALKQIFEKFLQLGYSPREISHIIQLKVTEFETQAIVENDLKK
jgi:hypothetical protein